MRIFSLTAFVTLLLLLPSFTFADIPPSNFASDIFESTTSTPIQILHSDEAGIILELKTSPLAATEDGSIQVSGLTEYSVEPGVPALPVFSTFIALPPEADISIKVDESDLAHYGPIDVLPVPRVELRGNEAAEDDPLVFAPGSITEQTIEQAEGRSIYDQDALFPGASHLLSKPMYMRDMRLVELKLFPLQYNPARKTITQASRIVVNVRFIDPIMNDLKGVSGSSESQEDAWRERVINYDQARDWRSLPQSLPASQGIRLPTGISTYKIEVDQDGIYEILGSELAAAGMNLPQEPSSIQMMQGGKTVAFQFIDENDNQVFDTFDKIRFYGWAFAGSRQEKLYITNNVFWLWAGGESDQVPIVSNNAGSGQIITSFRESITSHNEIRFSSNWAINWDDSPNDPTSWHWDLIEADAGSIQSKTFSIDLPNPDPVGSDATYLVELTTNLYPSNGNLPTYTAQTFLNDFADFGESSWMGHQNLNVVNTVPGDVPKQPADNGYPTNIVNVKLSSNAPVSAEVYLTRITVDYTRQLAALNDQLIFRREVGGQSDFRVSGFTNSDPAKVIAWDITDPHLPKQIWMQANNITGVADNHTYQIGRNHAPNASLIATTSNNVRSVKSVSEYIPVAIDPPSGAAQWLAITHSSLRDAADELASYRQPQMSAWVVNIEDVVNQHGFGFHTPESIRKYLQHALQEWQTAPNYVTLFGDATRNPRNLNCASCNKWEKDTPTLIVTDFVFIDRWQGMVPSDFSLSLLIGDDLIPDIAISRMPVNSLQEANQMVQKVILYETQRQDELQDWQQNLLFVADNSDAGGNFCAENAAIGSLLPDTYNQKHLCLPAPTEEDTNNLRAEMSKQVNDIGTSILNYRGHGSVFRWAGSSGSPAILTNNDTDFWQNSGRSVVTISADCLDGYFILTYDSALSEAFLRLNNRGSAAHWSSAGLGYSYEHSALHSAFYEGLFDKRQNSIGDAANFAKVKYYQSGRHISELYSFMLFGDAAMEVIPLDPPLIYFPMVSKSN